MKKIIIKALALSFCLFPIRVHADTKNTYASGNGWSSGTITLNYENHSFTLSMARSGNSLYSCCQTNAYIMRQHNAVTAYFNTYNHGNVYGYGSQKTVTTSGTSVSTYANCPYGTAQVKSIISGNAKIIMYADTTLPSDIRISF